jgi:Delta24(24(1))-sterol reductase
MLGIHRYCFEAANGQIIIPTSVDSLLGHVQNFTTLFMEKAVPSQTTWIAYMTFFVVQLVLAATMPGLTMYGIEVAPDGKRLPYHCNGYLCYYICIAGFFLVHFYGIFPGTYIADHYGEMLTASMIIADITSVYWYILGRITTDPRNCDFKSSGSIIYDFFMGTILYPRIGEVDIKMVAECRWSWLTLMLITSSFALKIYEVNGSITKEMMLMIYAHWLYSNATVKGEHCIPMTWDMFHERFGWMLNFWNVCGVPFIYSYQSPYIFKNYQHLDQTLSTNFIIGVTILLTVAYYIFDSANAQKANCKTGIVRHTFPQVPWGYLKDPKYLKTPYGNLLIDGWYSYARKMQYTGDILMALSWGLSTGFDSPLPYFYCFFFTCMVIHRQWRDEIKCAKKYKEYWTQYTKLVPNVFLPSSAFYIWLFTGKKPKLD